MKTNEQPQETLTGVMTVHEVADYLRLSEAKVYQMAKDGLVPVMRIGKTWRFQKHLIDEWIRLQTERGMAAPE